ncbi:MAG: glycosyltransferase family 2 protein [Bacteroidales bacterium]
MNNPLISIITPVYNSEKTISETIESVINQTYSNWELILVDDGSNDNSIEIIKNYCKDDDRIKLIIRDREPKGGSTCRNIGAFSAKGEYLIFLDSDDLLSNTCLENRLDKIRNTEYKFIVFPMASFENDVNNYRLFSDVKLSKYLYYFSTGLAPWQVTSTFWRRDFFYELNGFSEEFSRLQDVELHLRAIIHSFDSYFYFTDEESDCFYRLPKKNKYSSYNASKINQTIFAYTHLITLKNKYLKCFGDEYINSLSNLMLVCNIYYLIDISDYARNKKKTFDKVVKGFDIKKEFLWYHQIVYFIINNLLINTKLNFFFVRVIKRVLKRHL